MLDIFCGLSRGAGEGQAEQPHSACVVASGNIIDNLFYKWLSLITKLRPCVSSQRALLAHLPPRQCGYDQTWLPGRARDLQDVGGRR